MREGEREGWREVKGEGGGGSQDQRREEIQNKRREVKSADGTPESIISPERPAHYCCKHAD